MIERMRCQLARRQKKKADNAIRKLSEAAAVLGLDPIPGRVRVALRARYQTAPLTWAVLIPVAVAEWWLVGLFMRGILHAYAPPWLLSALAERNTSWATRAALLQFASSWVFVITLGFLAQFTIRGIAHMYDLRAWTYLRVAEWADVVAECADIVRSGRADRDDHLRTLSLRIPVMRVRGAWRARNTVGSFRRRRKAKEHAEQVVTALRTTEAGLDVDPEEAARNLARLLLKVSERYAQGKVGALLDPCDLQDPQPRHEALRLSFAVGLMAALALAAKAVHLPTQIAVASTVIVAALVFRRAAMAGLGVLAFPYPLLFPGK
ncbi:hypothetical protein ACFU7T_35055 [Streptomyces sp. NPDC057555]|uniref:hypothetical protein n=1 Tax=Streptomyces sp. NPDC057555 TaxID=3346166 RepID=UPI0036A2754C